MDTAHMPLRQLLYMSSSNPANGVFELPRIVAQSRQNNALDGVTGLLWSDGTRFLQVLEGPADSVSSTFDRIRRDPRHRAVVILHDREIEARQFGSWTMVQRGEGDGGDAFDAQMQRLLENASESVRGSFLGLIAAGADRGGVLSEPLPF
ncbi:BLUF domain-containing protein [Sphingomonas sp. GB1N7]|uniref:BLUF domain-containing protein n=1 Tax=Parasphingomonas caseinilytica TaxID=3096158 RepID=UPI002FC7AB24